MAANRCQLLPGRLSQLTGRIVVLVIVLAFIVVLLRMGYDPVTATSAVFSAGLVTRAVSRSVPDQLASPKTPPV